MCAKRVKEEYEEELCRAKEENERQSQQLDAVEFQRADISEEHLHPGWQELENPQIKEKPEGLNVKEEEEPEPPQFKKEEHEVQISEFILTDVIVKRDDDEKERDGDHHSSTWVPGAVMPNAKQKASDDSGTAKKRKAISMETKVAIIQKLESGEKVANVSRLYNRNRSTICTIYKNKDRIMALVEHSDPMKSTIISEQRGKLIGEMEKLLSTWIEHQRQGEAPLRLRLIKEKAKSLFEDLKVKAGEDAVHETFSVTSDWFDQFKKSANLHHRTSVRGKAASAHKNAAENRPDTLREIIQKEGDAPQQICNVTKKRCKCSQCDKTFVNKFVLKKHMIVHSGEKRFSCSDCGKRFTWKVHLKTHARTHTGEKPFACSLCDKQFAQKTHLRTHTRIHTGEKPFACSVCNSRFSERSGLAKHMRTHTGEKHFSCSICDKRFVDSFALKAHARTHTGEKPFACSICDKRFSAKNNLIRHTRTHTGKKRISCSVCGKTFLEKTNLIMHTRTHTGRTQLHTLFLVPILFPNTQTHK
ncbi:zinc finger protein 391-like [Phycodurus eques]|uniref:zinc finger protein 391-like n=1 Tax=Phycodurus eques TaxID=693459 RepID=UPI002ACF06FB|nr:zinc finger protein 391-like [Phycodurus eques]